MINLFKKKEKNEKKPRNKVGLVLAGGGARGFVQIGALKAFDESKVNFDLCAGTSVGSIIGALYCAGIPIDEIIEAGEKIQLSDLHGKILIKPESPVKIGQYVYKYIGDAKIENLLKPFACVACDINEGRQVVLNKGSVLDAISASSAYPVIFSPLNVDGKNLTDGGLVNNVPTDVAREMGADKIVTVDPNPGRGKGNDGKTAIDMLKAMFYITGAMASKAGLKDSDLIIAPDTSSFRATSKQGYAEMIDLGYNAAMEKMDEVKKLFVCD